MRLLLDTVTFIWALQSPERLSKRAVATIGSEDENSLEVSSISLSEIAIKHNQGKLQLSEVESADGLVDLQARVLPYATPHALRLFKLPLHHSDPFDRMLIAQALAEDIPVITSDEKFRLYKGLKVIW